MSEIALKTNYGTENYGLLLGQFKGESDRPNWHGIMEILSEFAQNVEEVAKELRDSFNLNTAIADQLDILGKIVGINRTNDDDEIFRQDIRFKILENRSAGESEFLQSALAILSGANYIWIKEIYPAFMSGYINFLDGALIDGISDKITQKMDDISGGGILYGETHSTFGAVPFSYAVAETGYGAGYGWDDGSGVNLVPDAGQYSWLITD